MPLCANCHLEVYLFSSLCLRHDESAVYRSALDLAVAATEAAAGEVTWRKTRSSAVDPPPSRSGEEELEARQSGQDLDAATRVAWRDRAEAEKAMQEASAQEWERASVKAGQAYRGSGLAGAGEGLGADNDGH